MLYIDSNIFVILLEYRLYVREINKTYVSLETIFFGTSYASFQYGLHVNFSYCRL